MILSSVELKTRRGVKFVDSAVVESPHVLTDTTPSSSHWREFTQVTLQYGVIPQKSTHDLFLVKGKKSITRARIYFIKGMSFVKRTRFFHWSADIKRPAT